MNRTAATFWAVVIGFVLVASALNAALRKIKSDKFRRRVRFVWMMLWILFGLLFVGSIIYGVNSLAELDSNR